MNPEGEVKRKYRLSLSVQVRETMEDMIAEGVKLKKRNEERETERDVMESRFRMDARD